MLQFLGFVSERVRDSISPLGNTRGSDDGEQITLIEQERILVAFEDCGPEEP